MRRLLLAVGLLALPAFAQQAPEPQVNPDRTVTFRLEAPSATKVALSLEGTKTPFAMTKGDAGVWTVTTPVLAPENYSYHFDVDGQTELDPRNPTIKASLTAAGNGFLVPGDTPQAWEVNAVPHGTLHHHTFTTKVVQGLEHNQSEYYVYTPAGYDPRGKTKYPVLYLLHGWSDTAGGWASIGHANDIFDALIAAGKAKPMIVVMPLGYGDMSFVRQGFGIWRNAPAVEHNTGLFSQEMLTEIVPMVEREYNVSTKREARAIAGLSMGGLESLTIGLSHPEEFAYVGGFSSAVFMEQTTKALSSVNPQSAKLKLLWIACGTEDDLITGNRRLVAALKSNGFPVTPVETPGMHTWLVWRDNLVHFAPLLFQN
jgi:enterochelin esterase-like enzyme